MVPGADRAKDWFEKLLGSDSRPHEFYALAPALVWGLLLLAPVCTFCSAPGYRSLRFVPEIGLAAVFLLYAGAGVIGIARRSIRIRRAAMLAGIFLWTALLLLLVNGNPAGAGWVHVVPLLAALLAYLQLGSLRRLLRLYGKVLPDEP